MKKVAFRISALVLIVQMAAAFALMPSVSAHTAVSIANMARIDLKFFDEETYTKKLPEDAVASPDGFIKVANADPSTVSQDSRQVGGVPGTVGESKAPDDAYFKVSKANSYEITPTIFELPAVSSSNFSYYYAPNGEKFTFCVDMAVDEKRTTGGRGIQTGVNRGEGTTASWIQLVNFSDKLSFNGAGTMDYEVNRWYTIYLEIDIKNVCYDVYIDGVLVADNVSLGGLGGMRLLRVGNINAATNSTVYLDNMALYPNEPFTQERYKVNKDAAGLSLVRDMLNGNESPYQVSSDLILPTVLPEGSTVVWSSSDPSVISTTGAVNADPITPKNVTLTATITNGSGASAKTTTKTFKVTVFKDLLAAAKNALTFDQLTSEPIDAVTKSLNLPVVGAPGTDTTITWESDTPDVLSNTGVVNTDAFAGYKKDVKLTATLTRGTRSMTKTFEITVRKDTSNYTDMDFINYDLSFLDFTDFCSQDPSLIVSDIILPRYVFPDFCTLTWSVSDSSVAKIEDYVASFTPKNEQETPLYLIATARKGNTTADKLFPITVIRGFGDNLITKEGARITATSGNPYNAVGRDFETYWESASTDEKPSITFTFPAPVTVNAGLFVEKGNAITAFKISVSNDGANWTDIYTGTTLGDKVRDILELPETTTKMLKFTVLDKSADVVGLYTTELFFGAFTDRQIVAMDKKRLTLPTVASSDITLPTTGEYGSTITWSSSAPQYISDDGKVTRVKNKTVSAILTATIKKGSATDTKVFPPITVPPILVAGSSGGSGRSGGGGGGGTIAYIPQDMDTDYGDKRIEFSDVPSGFWAHDYIVKLAKSGIVSDKNNVFRPQDSITREEFVKMLVLGVNIALEQGDVDFVDVDKNEWYYPYVAAAYNIGMVQGMGNGKFGIGMSISRQDMAVMVGRFLEKSGRLSGAAGPLDYVDSRNISDYAKKSVAQLASLKIMNGNQNREFMPLLNVTRAEAAKIICLLSDIL